MTDEKFKGLYDEVANGKSVKEVMETLSGEERLDFSRRFVATKGGELFGIGVLKANTHNPDIVDQDIGKIRKNH